MMCIRKQRPAFATTLGMSLLLLVNVSAMANISLAPIAQTPSAFSVLKTQTINTLPPLGTSSNNFTALSLINNQTLPPLFNNASSTSSFNTLSNKGEYTPLNLLAANEMPVFIKDLKPSIKDVSNYQRFQPLFLLNTVPPMMPTTESFNKNINSLPYYLSDNLSNFAKE